MSPTTSVRDKVVNVLRLCASTIWWLGAFSGFEPHILHVGAIGESSGDPRDLHQPGCKPSNCPYDGTLMEGNQRHLKTSSNSGRMLDGWECWNTE